MTGSKEIFHEQREAEGHIYAEQQQAQYEQLLKIEQLLHTSTLDEMRKRAIEIEMKNMDNDRADEIIKNLYANQQMTDKQLYKRLVPDEQTLDNNK